jgi:transcriptional regulator with XRE-family HTH domain
MMTVEFGIWVRKQLDRREMSQARLAELSGQATSIVSLVLQGKREPTDAFCRKIAEPLGLSPVDVMQKAGIVQQGNANAIEANYWARTLKKREIEMLNHFRNMHEYDQRVILALAREMQNIKRQLPDRAPGYTNPTLWDSLVQ